jgi:hypothetical protein
MHRGIQKAFVVSAVALPDMQARVHNKTMWLLAASSSADLDDCRGAPLPVDARVLE